MKILRYTVLVALAATTLPAMAQWMAPPRTPWYFGAGVGGAHLNRSASDLGLGSSASLDTNETSYTLRLGYMFSPYWGIEAAYYDFGKYNFHANSSVGALDGQFKAKSAGVNLVGVLPIDRLDLYGRVGWSRSELKANVSNDFVVLNAKDKENGALYGVGARWNFTPNWGLFVEWDKADKIRVDSYLVGVDFKF